MVPRVDVHHFSEPRKQSNIHMEILLKEQGTVPSKEPLALPEIRPETPRRSTDPYTYIAPPPQVHLQTDFPGSQHRPRNRSPYSRTHARSRSSSSTSPLAAPPMARAHSSPTVHSASYTPSPTYGNTLRPSGRSSPFRSTSDDYLPPPMMSPPPLDGGFEIIAEDSELDLTPRPSSERMSQPTPLYSTLNSSRTLAGRRQRPTSPLHSLGSQSSFSTPLSSSACSPLLAPTKFVNEAYPALHHYGSNSSFSSMPSTPTSTRSRSPSISSLDTIEDAPDLESEAIEAERLARLKLADIEEGEELPRRGSLEIPGTARTVGFGFGRAGRKRWSICGGERRADLDLETIWED